MSFPKRSEQITETLCVPAQAPSDHFHSSPSPFLPSPPFPPSPVPPPPLLLLCYFHLHIFAIIRFCCVFNTCIQWDSGGKTTPPSIQEVSKQVLILTKQRRYNLTKRNTPLSDSRLKALPFANQFCSKKGVHLPSKRSFFQCLLLSIEDSCPFPTPLQKHDCRRLQVFSKSQCCLNKLKSNDNNHTHTHHTHTPFPPPSTIS